MSGHWRRLADEIERFGRVARVAVVATRGSTPREIGAALILRPDGAFTGTIGGGAFEWRMIAAARRALDAGGTSLAFEDVILGPDLGQCCGGRLTVVIEVLERDRLAEARRWAEAETRGLLTLGATRAGDRLVRTLDDDPASEPGLRADGILIERFGERPRDLLLFGAGHVGRALVLALAPLPFRTLWIDGRAEAFPERVPANTVLHAPADPVTMVATAPPSAFVLAMTHDHALDFALVDAGLRRTDLPFIGVIGSATKRARFVSRLTEIGHTAAATRRMVCPVGAVGPRSKRPAVIAAAVAVELLLADEVARNTHERTGTAALIGGRGREEWV